MTKAHPQIGSVRCKDHAAWRREFEAQRAGRVYAQALMELPSAADPFYGEQYAQIVADWPQRQAFLTQHGMGDQLMTETLLIICLEDLLQ
jgi:hypothetical protein